MSSKKNKSPNVAMKPAPAKKTAAPASSGGPLLPGGPASLVEARSALAAHEDALSDASASGAPAAEVQRLERHVRIAREHVAHHDEG